MKGDMFNKVYQPVDRERLFIDTCNKTSTGKVELLQGKGKKFIVDGWLKRVMKGIKEIIAVEK